MTKKSWIKIIISSWRNIDFHFSNAYFHGNVTIEICSRKIEIKISPRKNIILIQDFFVIEVWPSSWLETRFQHSRVKDALVYAKKLQKHTLTTFFLQRSSHLFVQVMPTGSFQCSTFVFLRSLCYDKHKKQKCIIHNYKPCS